MAECLVRQVEKEVTCALCLDLFKEPKKLPCDHVYCTKCLRGLALRSLNATISCPECRTLTQVPGNDVNNFPTAFQTNRLIEAFKQVQVRVESDSPIVTEMCQIHLTQPLAIYCETCKKQLCRDCVLMSKEHSSHEYGFFEKVALKYREKVISELSLIKMQKLSISSALEEIAAAETNIEDHAQKCQDDVEHAFEELISALQARKRALKDEATAYYSSFAGVFDQQKQQLKDIESKIQSVVTSVDTTLQDNDQSFLMRLESTFERIIDLQKKFQAISLTVPNMQLVAMKPVDASALQQSVIGSKHGFYKLADAKMCIIDNFMSSFIDTKLLVGQQMSFIIILCDSGGKICVGENKINVNLLPLQGDSIHSVKGKLELLLEEGCVRITLTPEVRGLHQLNVKVNGAHIKNSPFTVTVYIPPNLLSQPVAIISELERPASLVYSQADDKILATVMDAGAIVKVDLQFHLVQDEAINFPHASEITQGADLNIFYATTTNNQLHKIRNDGRIIKSVGQLGKGNSEFNYPNGLRVNKKHELYVCDTRNSRVQVFDLDLNFKRSFGKHGTGKGQFNSPADVDFDSNGSIYVTELSNYRIQVFTSTECHIRNIIPGTQRINTFRPVSLLMHNENIYVTDANNHKVWVMRTSGEVLATLGVRRPEGITMDKAGFVYVTSDYSKIVVF